MATISHSSFDPSARSTARPRPGRCCCLPEAPSVQEKAGQPETLPSSLLARSAGCRPLRGPSYPYQPRGSSATLGALLQRPQPSWKVVSVGGKLEEVFSGMAMGTACHLTAGPDEASSGTRLEERGEGGGSESVDALQKQEDEEERQPTKLSLPSGSGSLRILYAGRSAGRRVASCRPLSAPRTARPSTGKGGNYWGPLGPLLT